MIGRAAPVSELAGLSDEARVGFLARESEEAWTRRFLRERLLPGLTVKELQEVIELGRQDERMWAWRK